MDYSVFFPDVLNCIAISTTETIETIGWCMGNELSFFVALSITNTAEQL